MFRKKKKKKKLRIPVKIHLEKLVTRGAAKKERAAVERAGVAKVECGGNQIASGHRDDYAALCARGERRGPGE